MKEDRVLAYAAGKSYFKLKQILSVIGIVVSITLVIVLFMYFSVSIAVKNWSFPIRVNTDRDAGGLISISDSRDFDNATTRLRADAPDALNCISVFDLPEIIDGDEFVGSHNGDGYIAYTFYLKNVGEDECTLSGKIKYSDVRLNADDAVRARIYRNGEAVTCAKLGHDGQPELGTTPFETEDTVYSEENVLEKDEIVRYTIVLWLEGDDPECVDAIKGGFVRLFMEFEAGKN